MISDEGEKSHHRNWDALGLCRGNAWFRSPSELLCGGSVLGAPELRSDASEYRRDQRLNKCIATMCSSSGRDESIGSNHLSAKAVLRQAAEAVNHCELLDECFALKSTCRDLVGEGIATLILIMVGITS